jgi:hypothetical protein
MSLTLDKFLDMARTSHVILSILKLAIGVREYDTPLSSFAADHAAQA